MSASLYTPPLVRAILAGRGHEVVANAEAARVIQVTVAERMRVHLSDLLGPIRTARVCRARKVAMYLCDELVDVTRVDIARLFERSDSHGVSQACRWVAERVSEVVLDDLRDRLRPLVCGERLDDVG